MKRESNFRAALVRSVRARGCQAVPIETGLTYLGVPDLFIRTTKVSAWIELKNLKYQVTYPFEVPFRPGQWRWLHEHAALGGLSILGLATPDGNYFFVGENIQRVYTDNFSVKANMFCENLTGLAFIRWLDSLV